MISTEIEIKENKQKASWKDKYKFPFGAVLLIFFQWILGMGAYCYILAMPIYMASLLGFTDTESTVIYHAKSGISHMFNIVGAVIADSLLGRLQTCLLFQPFEFLLMGGMILLSIYNMIPGIISLYFVIAILGGLVGPAVRAFIADQIPSDNLTMLSTYMHIIYLVNNFGVIIIAYIAPIMHKDVYCFGKECYPLVFTVSLLLTGTAFLLFLCGYWSKVFVIHKPTNNLFINIFRCIHFAIKKRMELGKPKNGKSFLDYAEGKYEATFINDIKIAKGLCIFLLAHPLFWTVFEQLSSVWTLQAQYMDGMVSDTFVVKPDQMQTLNPFLVVILIPIFEVFIYPLLNKVDFKVPYRIVVGQMFTALACLSMIFIQLNIDTSLKPSMSVDKRQINLINLGKTNISILSDGNFIDLEQLNTLRLIINKEKNLVLKTAEGQIKKSLENYGNILTAVIINSNETNHRIIMSEVKIQKNGGYASVRALNLINGVSNIDVNIKAKVGINKICVLKATNEVFGDYVKCGIGISDITVNIKGKEKYLGTLTLKPAESKTLIIEGEIGSEKLLEISEVILRLPSIFWQIVPYVLVTIGEVLFNVNTGIFLYGEAPMSMKSILLAAQYVCIAIGNIFILLLKQILKKVSSVYLFFVCAVLVTISGIFTAILAYFYLKNTKFIKTEKELNNDKQTLS